MTTVRDRYLSLLDRYRALMDTRYGLRQHDVAIRVTTWAGGLLPGSQGATPTVVDTPLLVNGEGRPKVEQVSQRDVIASGGLYQEQDLRVGPFTPQSDAYPAGVDPALFDPAGGSNTETLFKVTGPGYPAGAWFKKVGTTLAPGNFRFYIVLRKTGEAQGG